MPIASRSLGLVLSFLVVWAAGCAARAPQVRPSLSAAKQASTVAPDIACRAPSDCFVRSRTCCGTCGVASSGDSIALNREWAETHPYACTGGTGCPDCFQEPDPSLIATCTRGACRVVSVSDGSLARCTRAEECVVRAAQCCACGARSWLAVRRDRLSAYQSLVCGADTACPECVGRPPASLIPTCTDGHCVVGSIGGGAD